MRLFLYLFSIIAFSSCVHNTTDGMEGNINHQNKGLLSFVSDVFDNSLAFDEYTDWIKSNTGVTSASQSSDLFDLQLLFFPPEYYAFQTCLIQDLDPKKNFDEVKKNQSEFLFAKLLVTNKNVSVNNTVSNDDLLKSFISDIKVANNNDSISAILFETFISPIASKPHEILILISKGNMKGPFKIMLKGKDYALKDLSVQITEDDLNNFPKIKR